MEPYRLIRIFFQCIDLSTIVSFIAIHILFTSSPRLCKKEKCSWSLRQLRREKRTVFNASKKETTASLCFSFSDGQPRVALTMRRISTILSPRRLYEHANEFYRRRRKFCITRLFSLFREFGRVNMQRVGKSRISLTARRRAISNGINRCSGTTIISDAKNQNEHRDKSISAKIHKISQVFINRSNFENLMTLGNILRR